MSEKFAILVLQAFIQIDKVAPLLHAGIITCSPIRYTNIQEGVKVGAMIRDRFFGS